MSIKNRVIWHEGLFTRAQHFQQQQKHNDYQLHRRISSLQGYSYGFSSLLINQDLLKLGRIGLSAASGCMPDGTVFDIPHQDYSPKPLDVVKFSDANSRNIFLALPVQNDGINEITSERAQSATSVRYRENLQDVFDVHTQGGDSCQLLLAQLTPRLMQGSDDLSAYTTLPLCRIKEKTPDGALVLDDDFIPTCMTTTASTVLKNFIDEAQHTLIERSDVLANRIGSPGQQGIADVAEFMMLQVFNRIQPLFSHLAEQSIIHPEDFYRLLIQACGELRTFTDGSRLAGTFPKYQHNNLTDTFQPVLSIMRRALSTVLTPRAVSLPLQPHANGVRVATVNDRELLRSAEFVLAVSAQIPQEQLRKQFSQQTKITTLDRIRDLVSVQLPGVTLVSLSAAPRQLPYHSGYVYFGLDLKSAAWKEIQQGNSIAIHVSGEFPELDMQFWAIRSST
ncbi:type VI secretion system baseplate subunit TssK [Serratia microhaemolytica]|uniref:type VI secretion system baseplate subunit TssK n=1 Tax=Serratia microhaemolytica TaxID=2675110 RepID=UPI000FDDF5C7|nr:type VI secretion system baseplate subunit TssK [Serratia microhaemolytica]